MSRSIRRMALALCCLLMTPIASAFDLTALGNQLAKNAVVRGPFIQEKHLKAMAQPLTSRGQFVLAADKGLLWQLQSPIKQDYRINSAGIAKRTASGWQAQSGNNAAAQQSRLFLALLRGDSSGLKSDFDLQLQGTKDDWALTLTPRALLLKQIFSRIEIHGAQLVQRIELFETQGDRTLLKLPDSQGATALNQTERTDFAD
ncbi:outer membrane lipoprotein carrier protein LolA [Pseudomonas sp. NPDC078700]|uniref:outer membrane lipoprotein carrier protein LolA n=1 Tax=Pseudomonas sp. NPDC078700 TaxID=3364424 RepID=UPI0037C7050D